MAPIEATLNDVSGVPVPGGLQLLLIDGEAISVHPLPDSGEVVLGRGDGADLQLELARVSRRHAKLLLGATTSLEDLGSSNGILFRGAKLTKGQRVTLVPGDSFEIGQVTLLLQRRAPPAQHDRPRRVAGHDYFEGRLDEECTRAAQFQAPFALLRVWLSPWRPEAVERVGRLLRPIDVLAQDGDSLEVLLPHFRAEKLSAFVAELQRAVPGAQIGRAVWPVDGRNPEQLFERATPAARVSTPGRGEPVVADAAMKDIYALLTRIARADISVVLLGETGVGKEVLARQLHQRSSRSKGPFLGLNCGALTETLLESELFGHEKGAFTGAVKAKTGLFESLRGGTLFLDEIGEMPATLQVKLLRVLEAKEVIRVGGVAPIAIDVRVVAATHRDLPRQVESGAFRQDLWFRLNGLTIEIPPLRERPLELRALAERFVADAASKLERAQMQLTPEALELLVRYSWPGNIRELRNVIERAVVLAPDDRLTPEELPIEKLGATILTAAAPAALPGTGSDRERVVDALQRCAGNQTLAAKLLGISRRTLVTRLEEFELPRPRKKPARRG